MTDDAQASDPSIDLLSTAARVTGPWLRRSVAAIAARHGVRSDDWRDLDAAVTVATEGILTRLRDLLATDVDEQRTNPLSIYRSGVAPITDLLERHDVPAPSGDRFAADHFPDDPYRLGPASWVDVDPDLHMPGLVWGAWKAKTVLDRRRAEGRR